MIPMGVSFATDMPALFMLLLAVYCAMRGVAEDRLGIAIAWLCAAAAAGDLAALNRQVFAAAAPLMIGAAVAMRWRVRHFAAAGGVIVAAALALAVAAMKWQSGQPRVNLSPIVPAHERGLHIAWGIVSQGSRCALTLLLLMTPILVLFLATSGALRRKLLWVAGGATVAIAAVGFVHPKVIEAPWMGNLFTAYGPLRGNEDTVGLKPLLLSPGVQALLGLTVYAGTAIAAGFAWQFLSSRRGALRHAFIRAWETHSPILVFVLTGIPFMLLYTAVLVMRSLGSSDFDRYVAGVAAFPALCGAWLLSRSRLAERSNISGWAVLGLLALFGVASTHDLFATDRARLAAASWVLGQDVPRRCLTAGYEYDGETQLLEEGALRDAGLAAIKVKPVAYWFFQWTPAIDPCMYVVLSPQPTLGAVVSRIGYTTWLSPQKRQILVQDAPQPCPASCRRTTARALR